MVTQSCSQQKNSHLDVIYAFVKQLSKLGTVTAKYQTHTVRQKGRLGYNYSLSVSVLHSWCSNSKFNTTALHKRSGWQFTEETAGAQCHWHEQTPGMESPAFPGRHLEVSSTQHKSVCTSQLSGKQHPLAFKSHLSASDLNKTTSLKASPKSLIGGTALTKTSCWTSVHMTASQEEQAGGKGKRGSPPSLRVWVGRDLDTPVDSTCLGSQEIRTQFLSRKQWRRWIYHPIPNINLSQDLGSTSNGTAIITWLGSAEEPGICLWHRTSGSFNLIQKSKPHQCEPIL